MYFSNICINQIIGSLILNKQSGEYSFSNEDNYIKLWIDKGNVFSLRANNLSDFQALKVSSWVTNGQIKKQNSNFPLKSMEYEAEIERLILEESDPLGKAKHMDLAYIEKTSKVFNGMSAFHSQIEKLTQLYPKGFYFADFKKDLKDIHNLKALLYGTAIGIFSLNFKATIGFTLKKYQDLLFTEIKGFYGQGSANSFLIFVEKAMQDFYIKITIDQDYLGSESSKTWMKCMFEEAKKIGKSGLFEKWHKKILSQMNSKELGYMDLL